MAAKAGLFMHGGHAWAVVLAGKIMNVHFEMNGSDSRVEVKEASRPDTEPVSQISSIGQGSRQADNTHGVVSVSAMKLVQETITSSNKPRSSPSK